MTANSADPAEGHVHAETARAEQAEAEVLRLSGLLGRRDAELERLRGKASATGEYYARAKRAEAAVQRVREVRDRWLRNCLEPQTRSLLDDLSAALDGTTPTTTYTTED